MKLIIAGLSVVTLYMVSIFIPSVASAYYAEEEDNNIRRHMNNINK